MASDAIVDGTGSDTACSIDNDSLIDAMLQLRFAI